MLILSLLVYSAVASCRMYYFVGFLLYIFYMISSFQVLGFVSKVHEVELPEDLVDYESLTSDQVFLYVTLMVHVTCCYPLCKLKMNG